MSDWDAIIVGAGVSGLSAGCYAQMNGYRTRIFEHHSRPGGVVAYWRRHNYLVDGGVHFLMGHKQGTVLNTIYGELGILRSNRFVDMTSYGRFIDEASGQSVTVTGDLDKLAADLKVLSPTDAAAVDDLLAGAQLMRQAGVANYRPPRPPELAGVFGRIQTAWESRRMLRAFTRRSTVSMRDYAAKLKQPLLRGVLENFFFPEVPVWFVQMLLALVADGQLGLPEGGSFDLARGLETRYKELGGQIGYRCCVEQVLVEDERAVGVRLADGSEHRAGAVISAADGRSTLYKMLGGRYLSPQVRDRYEHWKRVRPLMIVSFGVGRRFAHQPWLVTLLLDPPLEVGDHTVRTLMVRLFNYSDRFAPPGHTVVQVAFDTPWDFWNSLHGDPTRYDEEKHRVAAAVLARLEKHWPDLPAKVDMTDVATPYTMWRYTLNDAGSYMGWMPAPDELTTNMERTLPGLGDFYMAGQWVMPGGGIPPCLYSGRHAAELLCQRDGKAFTTTFP